MADFSAEGENLAALRARIAAEVSMELERQVVALRCLHNGHGPSAIKGAAKPSETLSPAPAGAPPSYPTSSRPSKSSLAGALGRYYAAQKLDFGETGGSFPR
jgi:hypothetical protein